MKTPHIKEIDTVNIVDKEDMKDTMREGLENCSQEISLDITGKTAMKILTK